MAQAGDEQPIKERNINKEDLALADYNQEHNKLVPELEALDSDKRFEQYVIADENHKGEYFDDVGKIWDLISLAENLTENNNYIQALEKIKQARGEFDALMSILRELAQHERPTELPKTTPEPGLKENKEEILAAAKETILQAPETREPPPPPPAVTAPVPTGPDVGAASALTAQTQSSQAEKVELPEEFNFEPVAPQPEKSAELSQAEAMRDQLQNDIARLQKELPGSINELEGFLTQAATALEASTDADKLAEMKSLRSKYDTKAADLKAAQAQEPPANTRFVDKVREFMSQVFGLAPEKKKEAEAKLQEIVKQSENASDNKLNDLTAELTQIEQQIKEPEADLENLKSKIIEAYKKWVAMTMVEQQSPQGRALAQEISHSEAEIKDKIGDDKQTSTELDRLYAIAEEEAQAEKDFDVQTEAVNSSLADLESRWEEILKLDPRKPPLSKLQQYKDIKAAVAAHRFADVKELFTQLEVVVRGLEAGLASAKARTEQAAQERQEKENESRIFRARLRSIMDNAERFGKLRIERKPVTITRRGQEIRVTQVRVLNRTGIIGLSGADIQKRWNDEIRDARIELDNVKKSNNQETIRQAQQKLNRLIVGRQRVQEFADMFTQANLPLERLRVSSSEPEEVTIGSGDKYQIESAEVRGFHKGIDVKSGLYDTNTIQEAIGRDLDQKRDIALRQISRIVEYVGQDPQGRPVSWYTIEGYLTTRARAYIKKQDLAIEKGKRVE